AARIAELVGELETNFDELQFRKAAQTLRALWSEGNTYLEEKAPWTEIKTDPEGAALSLRTAMNLIYLFSIWSAPIIPTSAEAIRSTFALSKDDRSWISGQEAKGLDFIAAGCDFTTPAVLFSKITDEDLDTYQARFGGELESVSEDVSKKA
ncbi:MAG: class I tRNA ligase family protein, partial [Actinomycetia bacterium]|nr:class I tRNA ligase family protein [Actinomycetes bacterium]